MSWPHGKTVGIDEAVAILKRCRAALSTPLDGRTIETAPRCVQVWHEPDARIITGRRTIQIPAEIRTLHTSVNFARQEVNFAVVDEEGQLKENFTQGGRILIRVHCGHLLSDDNRPFSASLDGVLGTRSPHAPGGVHETWFFVKGG